MLRESSTSWSVAELAEKLADANLVVEPIQNTPLAELCNVCQGQGIDNEFIYINGQPALPNRYWDVSASSMAYDIRDASVNTTINGINQHDEAMEAFVTMATKAVQKNLVLARTIVNPIISAVLSDTETAIESENQTAVNLLSVVAVKTPELLTSPMFSGMIEKYDGVAIEPIEIRRMNPDLSVEEIIRLCATGSKRLDEEMVEYFSSLSPSTIEYAYKYLFARSYGLDPDDYAPKDIADVANLSNSSDNAIIGFLVARAFLANPPTDTGMSALDYRVYMASVMEQCGRLVCLVVRNLDNSIRDKRIVVDYPKHSISYLRPEDGSTISVNGSIYNEWLAKGGSPEILLGAYVSGDLRKGVQSADALLENADAYKAAWSKQFNLLRTEQMSKIFNTTVACLRDSIAKQIVALADDKVAAASRAQLQDRLSQLIAEVTIYDTKDLHALTRKLVCRTMFPQTDAEAVLAAVQDYADKNPNIDIKEAAFWATIDIVTDWVAKLFVVKKL